MAVPLEQIYVEAARELEVVEANEALSAEDRLVFAERYPTTWAMLEGRALALWGPTDPVPLRYAAPVWALLAEQCRKAFGKEYDASWALEELHRQTKPRYRYIVTEFKDY